MPKFLWTRQENGLTILPSRAFWPSIRRLGMHQEVVDTMKPVRAQVAPLRHCVAFGFLLSIVSFGWVGAHAELPLEKHQGSVVEGCEVSEGSDVPDDVNACSIACIEWASAAASLVEPQLTETRDLRTAEIPLGLVAVFGVSLLLAIGLSRKRKLGRGPTLAVVFGPAVACSVAGFLFTKTDDGFRQEMNAFAGAVGRFRGEDLAGQRGCLGSLNVQAQPDYESTDEVRTRLEDFRGIYQVRPKATTGSLNEKARVERLRELVEFFGEVNTSPTTSAGNTLSDVVAQFVVVRSIVDQRLSWSWIPLAHEVRLLPNLLVRLVVYLLAPLLFLFLLSWPHSALRRRRT